MADQKNGEGDGMLETTTTTTVTMATTKRSYDSPPTDHQKNMKKFVYACLILQVIFAILYLTMARYDVSADARNWKGAELKGISDDNVANKAKEDLKLNLDKYPCK